MLQHQVYNEIAEIQPSVDGNLSESSDVEAPAYAASKIAISPNVGNMPEFPRLIRVKWESRPFDRMGTMGSCTRQDSKASFIQRTLKPSEW